MDLGSNLYLYFRERWLDTRRVTQKEPTLWLFNLK
jgi:hypothetical protein